MSPTKLLIYPYSLGSGSARSLSGELGAKRVRPAGTYRYQHGHLVINWGNSNMPNWGTLAAYAAMLNKPQNVVNASEKTKTFRLLDASMKNKLPEWTTSRATAEGWLAHPKYGSHLNAVVCRTLTRANSGRGIVLARNGSELVAAPLYTRYKPKKQEYRVHVNARFGIVDIQEKRKRTGAEPDEAKKYIRSHDHDWVFCREGVNAPEAVKEAAEQALNALGLDFGAVDIGYHPDFGVAVYEVNTAPGIEGQTLNCYVDVFRRYLQS